MRGFIATEMKEMRDHVDAKHASARHAMEQSFDRLDAKLDKHIDDDRVVEKKVDEIVTERKGEKQQALKQSSIIALVVSAGIQAGGYLVQWLRK